MMKSAADWKRLKKRGQLQRPAADFVRRFEVNKMLTSTNGHSKYINRTFSQLWFQCERVFESEICQRSKFDAPNFRPSLNFATYRALSKKQFALNLQISFWNHFRLIGPSYSEFQRSANAPFLTPKRSSLIREWRYSGGFRSRSWIIIRTALAANLLLKFCRTQASKLCEEFLSSWESRPESGILPREAT